MNWGYVTFQSITVTTLILVVGFTAWVAFLLWRGRPRG